MFFVRKAVYVRRRFELVGALALLRLKYRHAAGIGLFVLTVAVTSATVYMALDPQLFPVVPEALLWLRLVIQVVLLWIIWWSTLPMEQPIASEYTQPSRT